MIRDYGEERFAQRIATAIAAARQRQPIERTLQLAEIVEKPSQRGGAGSIRPRKPSRLFGFTSTANWGATNGADCGAGFTCSRRSSCGHHFHSLEDRIVKLWMREQAGRTPEDPRLRHLPSTHAVPAAMKLVGRDIAPSDNEIAANPRARSARLRVAERLGSATEASQ